jgi:hypothetical protein
VERDRLKGDYETIVSLNKEGQAAALKVGGERDALLEKVANLEHAIQEAKHWSARPPLPMERQPVLAMPAWTLDHRFYALGAVLTRDQVGWVDGSSRGGLGLVPAACCDWVNGLDLIGAQHLSFPCTHGSK